MPRVVNLADFRPSPRSDGTPWVKARVDGPGGEVEKTIDLTPVDADPSEPMLRSFMVQSSAPSLQIVFVDAEGGEDEPTAPWVTDGLPYTPFESEVASILRARTYASGASEDTMSVLVSASFEGGFSSETKPTSGEVEEMAKGVAIDLSRSVGRVPGEHLGDARRVATLGTAAEVERSLLPEQAMESGSAFSSLQVDYAAESRRLRATLQWWAISHQIGAA